MKSGHHNARHYWGLIEAHEGYLDKLLASLLYILLMNFVMENIFTHNIVLSLFVTIANATAFVNAIAILFVYSGFNFSVTDVGTVYVLSLLVHGHCISVGYAYYS
mmetsp:Transcript_1715/g.3035  ORF Transcript_1715/g.3035 Transcript_1715/m.3035 type:complete len:105 (-) Transcript_1715:394-708(-)